MDVEIKRQRTAQLRSYIRYCYHSPEPLTTPVPGAAFLVERRVLDGSALYL